MSLSIGSNLPSLYTQQPLSSSSSSQASSGSSPSNMDDTYTPSSEAWNATESAIHHMDNVISVQVDTALSAQSDGAISNVMAMFGI
jgi:hypothetical protein